MHLPSLSCVGRDGQTRTFYYETEVDADNSYSPALPMLRVSVHRTCPPNQLQDEWFDLAFTAPPDGSYELQITSLENRAKPWYSAMIAAMPNPLPGDTQGPRLVVSSATGQCTGGLQRNSVPWMRTRCGTVSSLRALPSRTPRVIAMSTASRRGR